MDLDGYYGRSGPSSAYRPRSGSGSHYGPSVSYFAGSTLSSRYDNGNGNGGAYSTSSRNDSRRATEYGSQRRATHPPPPPPPPPPSPPKPERKKADARRKGQRRHRHRSTSSSETEEPTTVVSSLTSDSSASSSSSSSDSNTSSYTTSSSSSSTATSAYSFSSASDSSSDTSSASTSPSPSRSRHSNAKGGRTARPSAADVEAAAAAAAAAILRKERELKRQELELLEDKATFARDVQRRIATARGFETEDEALAQMQRLVALEDTTPSLQEYLRRTSTPSGVPLLKDGSASRPQSEAISVGANRVSGYQPRSLSTSHIDPAPGDEQQSEMSGGRSTSVLALARHPSTSRPPSRAASGSPVDGDASPPMDRAKDTPPPSRSGGGSVDDGERSAGTAPSQSRRDDSEGVTADDNTASSQAKDGSSVALVTIDPRPKEKPEPPAAEEEGGAAEEEEEEATAGDTTTINTTWAGKSTAVRATKGRPLATPMRKRLNVRVRRPRARSRSVATETEPQLLAPLRAEDLARSETPSRSRSPRHLISPPAPQSRYVSPQPDSSPRSTKNPADGAATALVPAPATGQPWSVGTISWPLQGPPPAHQQPQQPQGSTYYTTAAAGPLTNTTFKSLLCSEYVPPEGSQPGHPSAQPSRRGSVALPSAHVSLSVIGAAAPGTTPPHAGMQVAGAGASSSWEDIASPPSVHVPGGQPPPRSAYEPYEGHGANAPLSQPGGQPLDGSRLPEDVQDVDLAAFDATNPDGAPPPPQQTVGLHGSRLLGPDEESVVEFPPPPQTSAPDMPGPRPATDDGCGSCCCPWVCCEGCSCCSCWTRMLRCLFPCCYSAPQSPPASPPPPPLYMTAAPPPQPALTDPAEQPSYTYPQPQPVQPH